MWKTIRHIGNYLTESERKIVLFIFFVIICGTILKLSGYQPGVLASAELKESNRLALQAVMQSDYVPHYDLNRVTYDELLYISGIGPSTARSILTYQESHGFVRVEDLLNIKGIGQKRYEEWKESFFVISTEDQDTQQTMTETETEPAPNTDTKKAVQTKPANTKVNINTATLEQLVTLSGIGPAKAELIITYRSEHRFVKVEDIKKVKGIGDKTFEKLKDNIYIGE